MNLNEYAKRTIETAIYPGAGQGKLEELTYLSLGLTSEAGEVAGKIKKYQRDGVLNIDNVVAEIGDVFWYVARLCQACQVDPETVLELNFNKLQKRKENGTLSGSGDTR